MYASAEAQLLRDQVSLDVIGAGKDHSSDAVADIVLLCASASVTGCTEDADCIETILHEALGDMELRHRRPDCPILAPLLGPGITIDHEPAGFQSDGHVDNPIRDRLKSADRLAELFASPCP